MSLEAKDSLYYQQCSLNKPKGSMRGYLDGRIETEDEMPVNPTRDDIIYRRKNPTLKDRERQLTINKLGLEGGRAYVDNRLSRFAAETTIDWCGGTRPDGSGATGRLQQTHAFPYLGRICNKINQYVFQSDPVRENANEDVLKDISRDGKSINDLMRCVSDLEFAMRWCWIGIDAPRRKDDGTSYSLAEKEALKIRPYWQVYTALDVLDWHFNERGELDWIKTQHYVYDDSDPGAKPTQTRVVKLWQPGLVTEYTLQKRAGKEFVVSNEIPLTLTDRVPFVLVGDATAKPIAFDDLESINRTIMDLGSVDRANFFNSSYPQMVLPSSVISNAINSGYATNATEAGKLIVGFKNPILIDKDDPDPSYIMPDTSGIMAIGERILSLKRELFEVVGLALQQESRQVASAEAKEWDHLDVAAVMAARAELLEDAERKAVAISKAWDADFQEWEAVYNRDFDVGNFKEEVSALVMAGNMPLPASVVREIAKKLVDRLDRIGAPIDAEDRERIMGEIETWNPDIFGSDPAITG